MTYAIPTKKSVGASEDNSPVKCAKHKYDEIRANAKPVVLLSNFRNL